MNATRTHPTFTDAEIRALARRLLAMFADDWKYHLTWENVPLLTEPEWGRLAGALDDLAAEAVQTANIADRDDCIDSVYLWGETQ